MRLLRMIGLTVAASALLMVSATFADEVTVVDNIQGPEGPLILGGTLYYVGFVTGFLAKWDGQKSVVLDVTPGCGHNGLVLSPRRTLLVACDDMNGAILEFDLSGKPLRRWDADKNGAKFLGGINDLVVAANGGIYATLSGPFDLPPTVIMGKVFYLAPGADDWVEVADDLNYANGVAVSPDQKTLYVNETIGNHILKFDIAPDGTLKNRSNFALLNLLTPNKVESWGIGPDSLKVDSHGDLYVAQIFGGKLLKISPQGKLLHVFDIAAGDGVTNVAFGPGERDLYVTVVKDPNDPQFKGKIVRMPNAW
jgi:gluconolactonase